MPSIVLRDITEEEYNYLKTASSLARSPVLGFCLYGAIKYAATVIEACGLQGIEVPTTYIRRRGPLTAIEQSIAQEYNNLQAECANLRDENKALRDELEQARGWMYKVRRAARAAENTVADIVAMTAE